MYKWYSIKTTAVYPSWLCTRILANVPYSRSLCRKVSRVFIWCLRFICQGHILPWEHSETKWQTFWHGHLAGSLFPQCLKHCLFLPLRINQQMYLTQRHGSCFPLACFPFQRKCFQEKTGCYGSFTVNHFSIKRLENIQPFWVTRSTKHSQVHYNKNEEEKRPTRWFPKTMQPFAHKWMHNSVTGTCIRQLILTHFSSKATLTNDGILEKEDTFPDF